MARIRIDDMPVAEALTPEQEELIQGAGLKSFRPSIEALEGRLMMAGDIAFSAGVVTIKGSEVNDTAHVRMVNDATTNVLQVEVVHNDRTERYDASQVKSILFTGGDGNDSFTNNTAIDSRAYGGAGDDVLTGGSGIDVFYGGDGNDKLYGGAGNDRLYGEAGDDLLDGGEGGDLLNGGTGNNTYEKRATNPGRVLYVNFDGADISNADLKRWNADQVLDPKGQGIKVEAFQAGKENREYIINTVMWRLHQDFKDFDVDVQRHTSLAVEGQKATTLFIGAANFHSDVADSTTNGIATTDVGNTRKTDVGFVLRSPGETPEEVAQSTANTAAHEAGHTYGLLHVDNAGLNDLMRSGVTDSRNAKTDYTFLDRTLDLLTPEGTITQQNSYRTLMANLGLAAPSAEDLGPQGTQVTAQETRVQDRFGGCGCPMCRGAVLKAEAATTLDTSTRSAVGGEQLVTVDPGSGVVTGSPAGAQAVAAPASLGPDTALTDDVFASGFDSDDSTYSRWS